MAKFQLYNYDPSLPAAVIFIILFLLTTLLHGWQMFGTRTWFMIPFVLGGVFQFIGYIGRAMSATEESGEWSLGPYIQQSTLILVAPALFAASIYMCLGRVVRLVEGDKFLFVRRTWLTKIFVGGDILSFMTQAAGAGIMSSGNGDSLDKGSNIVLAGLGIQVVFFGLFIIASLVFEIRLRRDPTGISQLMPWRKHMLVLYVTSLLILIRSVFRLIEYGQGFYGYLLSHEVYLYIFDACLMLTTMVIVNWIHPSEVGALIRGNGKLVSKFRLVDVELRNIGSSQQSNRRFEGNAHMV